MLRLSLFSMVLWALPGIAADKLASLQVCLTLPGDVQLFSATPQPAMRQVDGKTWMLDFDFKLNGLPAERITKSGADCFRAWVPAQHVKKLALDFERVPLNLVGPERSVDLRLKADRWSDAGRVVINRGAWSTVQNKTTGTLTLERTAFVLSDPNQLPAGPYRLKFTPAPSTTDCPVTLHVVGSGTVRADRNVETYRELVEVYRSLVVPAVIAKHKLKCQHDEAAQVAVGLDDGVFRRPLEPEISRVKTDVAPLPLQLSLDGVARPFVDGMQVFVAPGQRLELADLSLHAAR